MEDVITALTEMGSGKTLRSQLKIDISYRLFDNWSVLLQSTITSRLSLGTLFTIDPASRITVPLEMDRRVNLFQDGKLEEKKQICGQGSVGDSQREIGLTKITKVDVSFGIRVTIKNLEMVPPVGASLWYLKVNRKRGSALQFQIHFFQNNKRQTTVRPHLSDMEFLDKLIEKIKKEKEEEEEEEEEKPELGDDAKQEVNALIKSIKSLLVTYGFQQVGGSLFANKDLTLLTNPVRFSLPLYRKTFV